MSGPDRRHAVGVARDTAVLLTQDDPNPEDPPREVLAAALLHDVGKVESGLGTFSRVAVTLATMAVGRERILRAAAGNRGPARLLQRAGLYLRHDKLGSEMLSGAGSDQLTVSWAGEHHLDRDRWSIDLRVADALKAADGD